MRLPLVLLLILLLPSSANATRVLSMDLGAMAAQADIVVHARVVRTEAVAVTARGEVLDEALALAGGHGPLRYETRVELDVIETLKPDSRPAPEGRLSFHLAGGRIGRFAQVVAGSPRAVVGDEIVVMLERNASSPILRVVGFSQGVWRTASLIGLDPLARSDRTGAELLPGAAGALAPSIDVRPLDALLSELRRVIALTTEPPASGGER